MEYASFDITNRCKYQISKVASVCEQIMCKCERGRVCARVCVHGSVYVCLCVWGCVYMCVCVFMCVCVCVCVCVFVCVCVLRYI